MSSKGNKKARMALEKIYGKGCFVERAGIRKITEEEEEIMKRNIRGFKKLDRTITYHHLRPRSKGGQATVENGANIARYNHDWLEQLPPNKKEEVNNLLRQFKISFGMMSITEDGVEMTQCGMFEVPEHIKDEDFLIIPVYDNEPKKHYNRAKTNQQYRQYIEEELEDYYEER